MERLPAVDIITVNYNGMQYIDACLDSLFKTEYPDFSVILADNGSIDGSVEAVQKKYPTVKIILNNENLGFAKANNIAVKAGKAEFIALLNNDTIIEKDWLLPLVRTLMKDDSVAAACSKLLFMENHAVLNGAGGGMNYLGFGYDIGMYENNNVKFSEKRNVFFPCAAACLIRRSAFEKVGGFDEKFFMYHEDVDLGWRLLLEGYSIKFVPDSTVYHAFGGTSLKMGSMAFRDNLGLRHALRSLIKNYELITLMKVLPVFIALGIRTTIKERSSDFLKCILWNLKMLPDTLKKRKQIQKNRRVKDRDILHLIWQEIKLPVQMPDYNLMNLSAYVESNNRRCFIDMSDSRWETVGYGWHGTESYFGNSKTKYRWSKDEAVFYLWSKHGNGIVLMDVLALSKLLKKERRFSVSVNNKLSHEFIIKSDNWETVTLPYEGEKGPLEIKIRVENTWRPDDLFKNGDKRNLGIGLKRAEVIPNEQGGLSIDGISVIIPTYNRIKTLLKTIKALENQSLSKKNFEIIVVDDGSTDSTEMELKYFMRNTSLNIRYFSQPSKRQGAARNLGIKHSNMPLLIFIGDDIVPETNFLEEHLNYHRENNKYGNVAVIGYTQWPREFKVTPFMRYIGEYGYQFGYSLIKGEDSLPFNFFYTSNISILRKFVDELEYVFDEKFDAYGWEDIELGYRLEGIGMKLLYNPRAVAYHYHPVDLLSFCKRQFNVGRVSRTFIKKHPELTWFLGSEKIENLSMLNLFSNVFTRTLNFMDKTFLMPVPHKFYKIILHTNYYKGIVSSET